MKSTRLSGANGLMMRTASSHGVSRWSNGLPKASELRLVPVCAKPGDYAASADMVERGDHLGEHGRTTKRRRRNQHPQFNPRGCRGQRRQARSRLPSHRQSPPQANQHVIVDPERVQAIVFDEPREFAERTLPNRRSLQSATATPAFVGPPAWQRDTMTISEHWGVSAFSAPSSS